MDRHILCIGRKDNSGFRPNFRNERRKSFIFFLIISIYIFVCKKVFTEDQSHNEFREKRLTLNVTATVSDRSGRWIVVKRKALYTDPYLIDVEIIKDASFKIADKSYIFERAVLRKKDEVWFPLEELVKKLKFTFISVDRDNLLLIRDDGFPVNIEIGDKKLSSGGVPFSSLSHPVYIYRSGTYVEFADLKKVFNKDFSWSDKDRVLQTVSYPVIEKFETFVRPLPEKRKEKKPTVLKPPVHPAVERFTEKRVGTVPAWIEPDVKIHISQYGTYTHENITKKRTRTYAVNMGGYVYSYKVNSSFRWVENKSGVLENDSKIFGFYGKNFWLDALDLNIDLAPLRSQALFYEGFSFRYFQEPFDVMTYVGRSDITVSKKNEAGNVKYFSKLGGVRTKMDFEKGYVQGDILYITSKSENVLDRGKTEFPRRNLVFKIDAGYELPFGIWLSTQYGFCNYNPDNLKDELIQDYDWRVELNLEKEFLAINSSYEFIGTDYASINYPSSYQDIMEYRTSVRLRPLEFVDVYTSYVVTKDNVDEVDSQPTTDSYAFSVGTTFTLPDDSSLGLAWDRTFSETTGPGEEYVEAMGSYGDNYSITYSKRFGHDLSIYATYLRSETDAFGSDTDSWSDTYLISIYKFIPRFKGSYIRFRHSMKKSWYMASGNFTTITNDSNLGIRFYPVRQLLLYNDWDLNRTESENIKDTAYLTVRVGAELTLNPDLKFGIDWQLNQTDINSFSKKDYNDWAVLFTGSVGFDIATPAKWAKIKGSVFVDENENGVRDRFERGLRNVIVKIPNEVLAMTDKNGKYLMRHVVPGVKVLRIDEKTIPFGYLPYGGYESVIEVKKMKTQSFDFALVKSGAIEGMVFIDENENGFYDKGEEGLEFIDISINDGMRWSSTDADGRFVFDLLLPGEYRIAIDEEDIPIMYKRKTTEEEIVRLEQGKRLEVYIPLQKKKIVKKIF